MSALPGRIYYLIMTCPSCGFLHPLRTIRRAFQARSSLACPSCGFLHPLRTIRRAFQASSSLICPSCGFLHPLRTIRRAFQARSNLACPSFVLRSAKKAIFVKLWLNCVLRCFADAIYSIIKNGLSFTRSSHAAYRHTAWSADRQARCRPDQKTDTPFIIMIIRKYLTVNKDIEAVHDRQYTEVQCFN